MIKKSALRKSKVSEMLKDFVVLIPTVSISEVATTLNSLLECDFPSKLSTIYVIHNGASLDESAVKIFERDFSNSIVNLVHIKKGNKSYALNEIIFGLKSSTLVYLTDDDVKFSRSILEQYQAAAERSGRGTVYGGPVEVDADLNRISIAKQYLPLSMSGFPRNGRKFEPDRDFFMGANWAAFSDDIVSAGGFDSRFGPGSILNATGQETDMMKKMRGRKFIFQYLESALVTHTVDLERYSVEFILNRNFRNGVSDGLRIRDFAQGGIRNKVYAISILARNISKLALVLPWIYIKENTPLKGGLDKVTINFSYSRGFVLGWSRWISRSDNIRNTN